MLKGGGPSPRDLRHKGHSFTPSMNQGRCPGQAALGKSHSGHMGLPGVSKTWHRGPLRCPVAMSQYMMNKRYMNMHHTNSSADVICDDYTMTT